jgi:dihydroneopterin aldolase
MKFHAFHGLSTEERTVGGFYLVDITCSVCTNAVETDRIEDTVDYAVLFDLVKEEMMKPSLLIEHVAGRILKTLKARFPQIGEWVVKVSKLNPPVDGEMASASVTLKS